MTLLGGRPPLSGSTDSPGDETLSPISRSVSPPWTRRRVGAFIGTLVIAVFFAVSWHEIGLGISPLVSGLGNIFRFIGRTLPPQFTGFAGFRSTISLAWETVCIAFLGTVLAIIISVPLAFLAARNTTPHPVLRWLARGVITLCRSIPDVIFAIVFVESLGIGILPGVLALGFHSVGMLGKLFAETIEQAPPAPGEAVASTGARRLQHLTASVVPHVLPSFSSIAVYRLDINLRSSVILGYVGAGGIGFALNAAMGELLFREASAIVLVMFVLIVLMEIIAAVIRRSLIGDQVVMTGRLRPRRNLGERIVARFLPKDQSPKSSLRPPWTHERVKRYSFLVGVLLMTAISLWDTKIDPISLVSSLNQIARTVALYFPPNFSLDGGVLFVGALQTACVALVATIVGVIFAIPIGLLAARNISNRWVYRCARVFLIIVRAVPELIMAIIFVVAVGLGLFAGTIAITVGTVGLMAKLIADSLEEVPKSPREAIASVGATPAQETTSAVIAPSVPWLASTSLYLLDVNFRSSTVLGIVGAGGIGYLLYQSIQLLVYRTTGAIIVVTLVVVLLIEVITNLIRKQLI